MSALAKALWTTAGSSCEPRRSRHDPGPQRGACWRLGRSRGWAGRLRLDRSAIRRARAPKCCLQRLPALAGAHRRTAGPRQFHRPRLRLQRALDGEGATRHLRSTRQRRRHPPRSTPRIVHLVRHKPHLPSRLVRGAVALVGDAAHVVSPITGAGFHNGLLDVEALAGALRTAPRERVRQALSRYQQQRLQPARRLSPSRSSGAERTCARIDSAGSSKAAHGSRGVWAVPASLVPRMSVRRPAGRRAKLRKLGGASRR